MHLVFALVWMIGPAPMGDLIGIWEGPAIIHLVSNRGWGPGDKDAEFPDPASLLLLEHSPPSYQYHALIRCRFVRTANLLVLRDCKYAGTYTKNEDAERSDFTPRN
jgi:hypothetical protein